MTVGGCCAKGRLTLLPKAVMPCVRLSGRIAILRIVADQAGLRFFKLEKAYDLLCGHCAELEKYLSNMDATKDIWQADIRKQMRRDRLPVIWTVIGIAVSIILAMIFG